MGKTMVRSTENYTGSMYMFPRLTLRNPLLVGNGMNSLERYKEKRQWCHYTEGQWKYANRLC
jgi:hypothetical protein